MKHGGKHLAARWGNHHNGGLRDVAPGKTCVTMFNEDGTVWLVIDVDDRIAQAFRRLARKARENPDVYLSRALVGQLEKFLDEHERGF